MNEHTSAHAESAPLTAFNPSAHPVVVAVGTRDSAAILDAARVVAARLPGAPVRVLSVVEPMALYDYGPELAAIPPSLIERQRARRLDEVCGAIARTLGEVPGAAQWPVAVRYGDPATAIASEAAAADAQLVVMGIGAHGPLNRMLGAETTLGTLRRLRCPVWAVAGGLRELPRTAVLATDFSPGSLHAGAYALPLLADGATLFLVHVWSRTTLPHAALLAADAAYERSLPGRFATASAALNAPPSVSVKPVELVGNADEEILSFARGHGADLLVAGTHGRSFVQRLFVGSVATALLRGAECSVLVVPDAAVTEPAHVGPSATAPWLGRLIG
ncbi:MAG TPA: universal stress protein [Gemmatimonadaceae bacterium]|nr:universal stress protein [Gemmatimonadaceae bacterium]